MHLRRLSDVDQSDRGKGSMGIIFGEYVSPFDLRMTHVEDAPNDSKCPIIFIHKREMADFFSRGKYFWRDPLISEL